MQPINLADTTFSASFDASQPPAFGFFSIMGDGGVICGGEIRNGVMRVTVQNPALNQDYSDTEAYQWIKANGFKQFNSLKDIEEIPGIEKKYELRYPVTIYRTVTVNSKTLGGALRKAEKILQRRQVQGYNEPRTGDFSVASICFTSVKNLINNWYARVRANYPHNSPNYPIPKNNPAVGLHHGVFQVYAGNNRNGVAVPDSYFKGESI